MGLGILAALQRRASDHIVTGLLLAVGGAFLTWAHLRAPPPRPARTDPVQLEGRLDDSGRVLIDAAGLPWRLGKKVAAPGSQVRVWGTLEGNALRVRGQIVVRQGTPTLRQGVRRALGEALGRHASPAAGALLRASLLGERGQLPFQLRQAFVVSGSAHLLCISGLHVGLLGGLLLLLARAAGGSPTQQRLLIVGGLIGFLLLVGPRAPTVRATIGAVAFFLAPGRGDGWNRLACALLCVLVWEPSAPGDVGFRLSFGCVAGLLALAPLARVATRGRGPTAAGRRPRAVAVGAALAFVGTVPLLATQLGELPLVTILVSVPAIALFTLVLACAATGSALAVVLPLAGAPLLVLAGRLADALIAGVALTAEAWPAETLVQPTGVATALAAGWLGVAASRWERGAPARGAFWIALLLAAAVVLPRPGARGEPTLTPVRGGLALGLGPGNAALGLGRIPARGSYKRAALRRSLRAERIHQVGAATHLRLPGVRLVRLSGVVWVRAYPHEVVVTDRRSRTLRRLPQSVRQALPQLGY